ncbi:MAG TPA: TlpA disulfide reductase family protein [Pseudomonadales bacterium]|nr:TlpA disulfide reductase family protein [Pseudomonadales bacterium]
MFINCVHGALDRFSAPRGVLLALALMMVPMVASAADRLNADKFNLANYKGKVVYLDFWASWCGPCKFSFPYMETLSNTFAGRDFVIIADNLDHNRARADAFLNSVEADFPIVYDKTGILANKFNVSAMPTAILIDRTGKVRYIHKGFHKDKEDDYTSQIFKLLNEKH